MNDSFLTASLRPQMAGEVERSWNKCSAGEMWTRPRDLFTACVAGPSPSSLFGQPVPPIQNLASAEIMVPLQVRSDVVVVTSLLLLLVGEFQLLPPKDQDRVWGLHVCGHIITYICTYTQDSQEQGFDKLMRTLMWPQMLFYILHMVFLCNKGKDLSFGH